MPSQLSGGQQQRVALARAIVNEPAVVLLDEPLAALDRFLRRSLQEELRRLQRELGSTFVFVTHDQDEALAISDRVAVMNEGRLVQVGTPEQIYERPASRFVAEFVGDSVVLNGSITDVRGEHMILRSPIGELIATSAPGCRSGQSCQVVIRPEHVVRAHEENPNRLSARVQEVRVRGPVADIFLIAGDTKLVSRTTPTLAKELRTSEESWWTVLPETIHVIPSPEEGAR
jgi:ABC-type Fe3+/spermidine/putrescine transport system ATPase subunit